MRITWNRVLILLFGALALAWCIGAAATPNTLSASVLIRTPSGLGSGTHIGDGKILTAAHVVGDASKVSVRTTDGSKHDAAVVWRDEAADLAIIDVHTNLPSASLRCSGVRVGDAVTIIGNPGGIPFVTHHGFISSPAAERGDIASAFVLDATAAKGMSGGGVFDSYGRLIAVTVAIYGHDTVSGITLAVPVKRICKGVM